MINDIISDSEDDNYVEIFDSFTQNQPNLIDENCLDENKKLLLPS